MATQEKVMVPETGREVTVPTQVRDLLPPLLFQSQGNSLPENLDDMIANVQLTDEETATLMRNARIQKYWRLRDESITQVKQAMVAEANRRWDWKDQYDYLWVRCEELKIPAGVLSKIIRENERAVKMLCEYFTNSSDFEKRDDGYSLQKSIYLHGYVGTGKTTLLRLFSRNKKMCFNLSRCMDIQNLFIQADKDAQDVVEAMVKNIQEPRDIRYFFQRNIGRWFDDLGTEERPINHYGTKRFIMAEIMLGRYDARGEGVPMHSTHVTSNMPPFDITDGNITRIEQEYGTRVYDRFRDMYNVIELTGGSLRGE